MNNIKQTIMGSESFLITSHYSPDGDNIGSCTAMYHALKHMKKSVSIVLDDSIPKNLKFLIKDATILNSSQVNDSKEYTLIALDCGDKSRLCCSDEIIQNANILINIDHHASNNSYGDFNYVNENASSTCEMVYNLLNNFEMNLVNQIVGKSLYTGLVTDTGNFMYSNVSKESFEMAYNLLNIGVDKDEIIYNIYQSNSYSYFKILGDALRTLDIVNDKVATISIDKNMFKKHNVTFNNVDGIVNFARDIENIELGIFFKEKNEKETKVSFRSKTYIDVNKIASNLGGGGHVRAAGCTIHENIKKAKKIVLNEVIKHLGD